MTFRTARTLVVLAALPVVLLGRDASAPLDLAQGAVSASRTARRPLSGRLGEPALPHSSTAERPIDRHALVARHNAVLTRLDPESPLSVGNGSFAFTADVTGLQTFPEAYETTVPLGTLSDWGWHTFPNPLGWSIDSFAFTPFESHGRRVGYADIPGDRRTPEVQWLRANPHRLHLGRIGFDLRARDGKRAGPGDLSNVRQSLDMWTGELTSRFSFDGQTVEVRTLCHPQRDVVAVRVRSALVREGRIAIELRFSYGTGAMTAADWSKPEAHETTMIRVGGRGARFARRLDGDRYEVSTAWEPGGAMRGGGPHQYTLRPSTTADSFAFVAEFLSADVRDDGRARSPSGPSAAASRFDSRSPRPDAHRGAARRPYPGPRLPQLSFDEVRSEARRHWNRFWLEGGAIDLSASHDPRWRELERRIVLSQYLTAIQCSGRTPPQESGLTFNSWEGKFHLEMHWWHAAHFALWKREGLLERGLDFYRRILPRARATAARQGYRGARWPKMTNPDGAESPSTVGPFLVWQQPHPIFYAELAHRAHPTRRTLERFREVVFETAEFMASFAVRDHAGRFALGPPLHCAQEVFPRESTVNCTYELAYWRWGLQAAQEWRRRMGLPREAGWDEVLKDLAPLPVGDGKYLFAGSASDSYENPRWRRDHPSVVAAFGVLPGPGVDRETMQRTFDWIWEHWNWPDTWGWDYPMLAMTAARLGNPARAIDALLLDTPKNVYRANGHNYQRPGLAIYLPGNGGLLYAVAMMAAGWDGAPGRAAPGFPADGSWIVRYEGLRRAP